MHAQTWSALLQRIPESYHDAVSFNLKSGAEVVLQRLIRLEQEFVLMRARLAGQDVGRVMVVPWVEIESVIFSRNPSDAEIETMFVEPLPAPPVAIAMAAPSGIAPAYEPASALPVKPAQPPRPALPVSPTPSPQPPTAERDAAPRSPASRPDLPSKTILLAKLRARIAEANASNPGLT